jgi:ribosomal silencing factor RsfS
LRELELKEAHKQQMAKDGDVGVDWLQNRRQALNNTAIDMLPPSQAQSLKDDLAEIPVKMHALLTKDEIAGCLESLGGRDITIILDDPHHRRMGGAMGIIVVTASTQTQMRVLADTLVRQMRRRKLQEVNVLGAQFGPEGTNSTTSSDDTWFVVDCRNYIVHFQDEWTRDAVDLKGLWSGKDSLHRIDPSDEDQIEAYIAKNPAPSGFGRSTFELDETMKQLQKSRWTTAPHKPVVPKKAQRKRRRN